MKRRDCGQTFLNSLNETLNYISHCSIKIYKDFFTAYTLFLHPLCEKLIAI